MTTTTSEADYQRLVEPHRRELHAHCYRMLGSVYDADDALQEALVRAWRSLDRFEGRSSLRSWLYRIATNTCLDVIEKRPKQRVLPMDYTDAAAPDRPPGEPVTESVFIEPYPDEGYEQRESVELAFIAALQHLPANQRAVLIMREVLGFSAKEVAETLDTSVASVNSALQRARAAVEERVPDQTQQETLRTLGDEKVRELVERYVSAWESNDVEAFTAMLTEDAEFSMPPLATWYSTREGISTWARLSPLSGDWSWKTVETRANGQIALGFYALDRESGAYLPFALNVLTLRGEQVSSVTAFVARSVEEEREELYARWPEMEADDERLQGTFGRFGLPERLD